MKRLRRVTESEVIAEFLKNEFYQEEFHRDREQFEHLVEQNRIMSTGRKVHGYALSKCRSIRARECAAFNCFPSHCQIAVRR